MKNKFIQNTPDGCSLYCMANLFNDSYFIDQHREKTGKLNLHQENEIIKGKYPNLSLRNLVHKNSFMSPLKWPVLTETIVFAVRNLKDQMGFIALQLNVSTGSVNHSIYLYVFEDRFILSDPLKEECKKFINPVDVKNYFQNQKKGAVLRAISVYCVIDDDLEERIAFFDPIQIEKEG